MRYLATWQSARGITFSAIVVKIKKITLDRYTWSCKIIDNLSEEFSVGTEICLADCELTPMEDPVDILKEML